VNPPAHDPPPGSRSIDDILATARTRLRRLQPTQAYAAQRSGALIVERNVLEWRFDPRCPARLPIADRYDLPVIVLCQEGYTSSLAAAALHDLGLHQTTDIIGGFTAWTVAGLPRRHTTAPQTE